MSNYYLGYARDEDLRFNSSSGGLTKAFLSFLVDNGEVDEVIFVRTAYPEVEVVISENKNEWLTPRANSVYADVDPLSVVRKLNPNKKYAITLLPCYVKKLRKMQQSERLTNVNIVIGLICNHTPNSQWTENVIKELKVDPETIDELQYRGNGFPGEFQVKLKNGETRIVPSLKVWSNNTKYMLRKCWYCNLLIANEADIIVGDPWGAKTDYGSGKTMVKANNENVNRILNEASKYVVLEDFSEAAVEASIRWSKKSKNERHSSLGVAMP